MNPCSARVSRCGNAIQKDNQHTMRDSDRILLPVDYEAMRSTVENLETCLQAAAAWGRLVSYEEFLQVRVALAEIRLEMTALFHIIRTSSADSDPNTSAFMKTLEHGLEFPEKLVADALEQHDADLRAALEFQAKAGHDGDTDRAMELAAFREESAAKHLAKVGPLVLRRLVVFANMAAQALEQDGLMDQIVTKSMRGVPESWDEVVGQFE